MTPQPWLLIQGDACWHVARRTPDGPAIQRIDLPDEADPQAAAAQIHETLSSLGYHGDDVLLGIPSTACLVGHLTLENPADRRHRQTLLYQLEQVLPLAAEDIVADFMHHDGDTLAVVAQIAHLEPWLAALENQGVRIRSISPTALLAAQHLAPTVESDSAQLCVLWGHANQVEWFVLASGQLRAWQLVPSQPSAVVQRLNLRSLEQVESPRVMAIDLPPEVLAAVASLPDVQLLDGPATPLLEAATLAAGDILSGKQPLWFELRRDRLAPRDRYRPIRGPLRFAMISAAALLLLASAGLQIRAARYESLLNQHEGRQADLFREALPGQPIPVGIQSRLESESAKLAGLKGDATDLAGQRSALAMLYDVLAACPEQTRVRILEMRLQRTRVDLEGELRSHADADVLATALRQRGFQVEPPRTQQLPGQGVAVRLTAQWAGRKETQP